MSPHGEAGAASCGSGADGGGGGRESVGGGGRGGSGGREEESEWFGEEAVLDIFTAGYWSYGIRKSANCPRNWTDFIY
jgi:hypothetical protein